MKKILSIILGTIVLFCSCKKDDTATNNDNNNNSAVQVSIGKINYPSFDKSAWNQVTGGKGLIEFDLKDAKDSVFSRIKDSTDLQKLDTYTKTLNSGTYDISVASANQNNVADTFMRFKAVTKSLAITGKQAISLTASSADGLITIGKSFIQDNTIPVFKADGNSAVYKLGLINGFYYLYIKGGVKGSVSFVAKANGKTVNQSLAVVALNQYNMEVVISNASLSVVFTPFVYNQVSVSSTLLLNVQVDPSYFAYFGGTYFVIADADGNVLTSVKYVPGTTNFKILSPVPYEKERINVFEVNTVKTPGTGYSVIVGFLQVKKGITYTHDFSAGLSRPTVEVSLHLKNSTSFDQLKVATDGSASTLNSVADSTFLRYFSYSAVSKVFVEKLYNGQAFYNFFDITNGSKNYNIDLTQLTKPSLVKSISSPGTNLQVDVAVKTDIGYVQNYGLGAVLVQGNQLNYYYPSESFAEYDTRMSYSIGSLKYTMTTSGTTIPDRAGTFDASFSVSGSSTVADFKPSFSGTFDFYHANFSDSQTYTTQIIDLFSPSAANYTTVKLPDFTKYGIGNGIDLKKQKLRQFGLYQSTLFKEEKTDYREYGSKSYYDFNSKAVEQYFIN